MYETLCIKKRWRSNRTLQYYRHADLLHTVSDTKGTTQTSVRSRIAARVKKGTVIIIIYRGAWMIPVSLLMKTEFDIKLTVIKSLEVNRE